MNPYDILDKDNLQKVANAGIVIENRKYSEEELKIFSHNILEKFGLGCDYIIHGYLWFIRPCDRIEAIVGAS